MPRNATEKPVKAAKQLTVIDGWAVGAGAMIGVTIFVVSGTMSSMAGPAVVFSFLIAAAITVLIALCFCEVSAAFPRSGGSYIYPKEVLGGKTGDFLSFMSGFALYSGQGLLGPATLGLTLAYYVGWSLELIGLKLPVPDNIFAVLVILFFGIANIVDTRLGSFIQLISTFAVIIPITIYIIWGTFNVDTALYKPFMPFSFGGVMNAAALGWLAFSGWSTIPNMASEFKNPVRDVPRSMILSLVTCGLLFSGIVLIMNGLLPYSELGTLKAPMASSFAEISRYGALIIAVGGIFAAVSTLNGLMMSGSRMLYSMGLEGSLPHALSKTNPRNATPWVAVACSMVGMLLASWSGALTILVQSNVFITAFSWTITCICQMVLRTKRKDIRSPFRTPFFPVTPILSIIVTIIMIMRLSVASKVTGICILVFAALLYLLLSHTPLKKFCKAPSVEQ